MVELADTDGHQTPTAPSPDADQIMLVQWYQQVCTAAAARLTGRCREVFALHCLAGYEIRDVASMLEITTTTVRVHLSNARRQLVAEDSTVTAIRHALHQEGVS